MLQWLTLSLVAVLTIVVIKSAPARYRTAPTICNATETFWTDRCHFCQCNNGSAPMTMAVECSYDMGIYPGCSREDLQEDPSGGCCKVCPPGAGGEAEEELEEELGRSHQPSPNNPTQPPTEEELVEENTVPAKTMPTVRLRSGPNEEPEAPHITTPVPTVPVHNAPGEEEEEEETIAPLSEGKTTSNSLLQSIPEGVTEGITENPFMYPATVTRSTTTASRRTTTPKSSNDLFGCGFLIQGANLTFSLVNVFCSLVLKNEKKKRKRKRKRTEFWSKMVRSKLRVTADEQRLNPHVL